MNVRTFNITDETGKQHYRKLNDKAQSASISFKVERYRGKRSVVIRDVYTNNVLQTICVEKYGSVNFGIVYL